MMPSYLTDYLKLSLQDMGFVFSAVGFGGAHRAVRHADHVRLHRPQAGDAAVLYPRGRVHLSVRPGRRGQPDHAVRLLFFAALFNFSALAILAGPVAAEAAPLGMVASVAGLVIGAGEVFGGGVAPAIAGQIAGSSGIQHVFTFTIASLIVGFVIALFLKETAPRKTGAA